MVWLQVSDWLLQSLTNLCQDSSPQFLVLTSYYFCHFTPNPTSPNSPLPFPPLHLLFSEAFLLLHPHVSSFHLKQSTFPTKSKEKKRKQEKKRGKDSNLNKPSLSVYLQKQLPWEWETCDLSKSPLKIKKETIPKPYSSPFWHMLRVLCNGIKRF